MSITHTEKESAIYSASNNQGVAVGHTHRLTHQDWIPMLKGLEGYEAQQQAFCDLANYLFVVVRRYLHHRQPESFRLADHHYYEIDKLAEDIVQSTLEKIASDGCALLNQYQGKGTFTAWAAQIVLNHARSELRRVRWSVLSPLDKIPYEPVDDKPTSLQYLQKKEIYTLLRECLSQLPSTYQTVLVRCIMNGEPAAEVAKDLKRSAQAVYNLIYRAKKKLRQLLEEKNLAAEDLTVFYV